MQSEMRSFMKNKTWDLVSLPHGKKALPCKWVYKLKVTSDDVPKYKARLTSKGFHKYKGVDFDEIFSPIVNMTTLKCIFGLVEIEDMELMQMNVETTFLHGDIHKEMYMVQP